MKHKICELREGIIHQLELLIEDLEELKYQSESEHCKGFLTGHIILITMIMRNLRDISDFTLALGESDIKYEKNTSIQLKKALKRYKNENN